MKPQEKGILTNKTSRCENAMVFQTRRSQHASSEAKGKHIRLMTKHETPSERTGRQSSKAGTHNGQNTLRTTDEQTRKLTVMLSTGGRSRPPRGGPRPWGGGPCWNWGWKGC